MKKETTEKNRLWLYLLLAFETVAVIGLIIYAGSLSKDKKELETLNQQTELTSTPVLGEKAELTDAEVQQIASERLKEYRSMICEYFMTFLKTKGNITDEDMITINGVHGYVEVIDERYSTLQDVKNYIETICTKEHAEELYEWGWGLGGESPFLAEQDGKLYTKIADAPYGGGTESIPLATLNSDGEIVFVYRYVYEEDTEFEYMEEGTIVLEEKDGNWYVKNATAWK